MDNILKALKKADTLDIVKDIINSVNDNQMECKSWLLTHLPAHDKAIILGGWYGYLASFLRNSVSVDIDPKCKQYGKIMYPGTNFITADAFECMMKIPRYDMIINTSCEHMDQASLSLMFAMKRRNSYVAFQSNNYYAIEDHINCKATLDEFISDYDFKEIVYKGELDRGDYKRWMVIGT